VKRLGGVKELKFYYAGDKTKRQVLAGIVANQLELFALAVDKRRRKVEDSPENFAIIVAELLQETLAWKTAISTVKLTIDRHFFRKVDMERFDKVLRVIVAPEVALTISHLDSQQNLIINLADFVAGALLSKYNRNKLNFYEIIRENLVFEKAVGWPELKQKYIKYIKN
jgi:hypothetical protein